MKRVPTWMFALTVAGLLGGAAWVYAAPEQMSAIAARAADAVAPHVEQIKLWQPLIGEKFNIGEKIALCMNVVIALAGL